MDLTLRKAALEACGWAIETRKGALKRLNEMYLSKGESTIWMNGPADDPSCSPIENCPAIESDEGIAIRALVEFCDRSGHQWLLAPADKPVKFKFECELAHQDKQCYLGQGNTVAECICKVLIAAAKGQSK